jgi:lysophospholipase L1-like esterase
MSAGGEATSDPARLSFGAFEDLAVSLYLAGSSGPATGHLIGRQLSYESAASTGDHVAEASAGAFANSATTVDYVDEVDTLAPASTGAVVALGDSITDGYESPGATGAASLAGIGLDHRYPDYLARRLLRQRGAPRLSVVNAGISGNQLLVDEQSNGFGLSAFSRLDTDVLGVAGVSEAIVLEGINDIAAQTGAAAVEGALGQIVGRLHANGIRVLVGTIMPAGTGAFNLGSVDPGVYVDTPADGVRAAVNSWIRSGGSGADGVVDFDAAMRSPAVPNELNPIFDSGDHIHPNDLGYSVMSAAIDLSSLRASRCAQASDTSPAPAS